MKMKRICGAFMACACVFGAADAFAADTVAVMKLDILGSNVDKQATVMFEAVRSAVSASSDLILDANGGDFTYTEMQMVTGCDKEASIACYDAACETLGAPAIIFGSVKDGGEAHLVWYVSGKGIFREVKGTISDDASVEALAEQLVVGEKGSLIVTSNVPGADVFIDGKRMGMSAEFKENATPIELVTGKYIVTVRKDGFSKEDAVNVTIEGGQTASVHVDMSVATDPEAVRRGVLIGGYTSLGVGAVSTIVAGTLACLTGKERKKIVGDGGAIMTGDKFEKSKMDKAQNMEYASIAMFGVGGFFLAAGVAMVVTGFVYDFAGEDIDKALAANPYIPTVDVSLTRDYRGMTMGWAF